jgi:Na+-transporting methylmalonyl-CoA/oxaloacetate decarboxylase gamma subunit
MFDNFLKSMVILVVGLGGVFSALLLLAGMIWLLKSADEWINRSRIRKYARKAETTTEEEGLNDEIVAVITAAATAAMRRRVRVKTVRFLAPLTAGAWSSSGRLNIMASHQISRRKS